MNKPNEVEEPNSKLCFEFADTFRSSIADEYNVYRENNSQLFDLLVDRVRSALANAKVDYDLIDCGSYHSYNLIKVTAEVEIDNPFFEEEQKLFNKYIDDYNNYLEQEDKNLKKKEKYVSLALVNGLLEKSKSDPAFDLTQSLDKLINNRD